MAKVLLIALDVVGKSMAGPAIRYYEFARALAPKHEVVLMTPNVPDMEPQNFRLASFKALQEEIKRADVVVCQQLKIKVAFWLAYYKKRLIIDAYDPQPLEHLEIFKAHPLPERYKRNRRIVSATRFSLVSADGILCANSPQRDLWLGFLKGQECITPALYDEGRSLDHYIATVPFGLPDKALEPRHGMRQRFGIAESDIVLLWGGGIWNWFDPLSLIRAVALLAAKRGDIKLVFMGIKHPNEQIPAMRMAQEALELAQSLGLYDKYVFFNFGWTPYEERQAFLHEADIGVSTHFDHLETRYAFRTRMLDYLWAGLPIVATCGDSFAELIQEEGVGLAVPYGSPEAIAKAIETIAYNPKPFRAKAQRLSQKLTWPQVTEPLDKMIEFLAPRRAKGVSWRKLIGQVWEILT